MGLEIFSPFVAENWERLLKYWVSYVIIFIIIMSIVSVLNLPSNSKYIGIVYIFALLVVNFITLEIYEKWRGCKAH